MKARIVESVRWNACVHRLDLGLYSHPKQFLGNGVRTPRKNPLYQRLRGRSTCDAALRRTASPTHSRLSYSAPSYWYDANGKSRYGIVSPATRYPITKGNMERKESDACLYDSHKVPRSVAGVKKRILKYKKQDLFEKYKDPLAPFLQRYV